jgi:hypothetical protein
MSSRSMLMLLEKKLRGWGEKEKEKVKKDPIAFFIPDHRQIQSPFSKNK